MNITTGLLRNGSERRWLHFPSSNVSDLPYEQRDPGDVHRQGVVSDARQKIERSPDVRSTRATAAVFVSAVVLLIYQV